MVENKKSKKEITEYLYNYNLWRRGNDDVPDPDPVELGEVLDKAISYLAEEVNNDSKK